MIYALTAIMVVSVLIACLVYHDHIENKKINMKALETRICPFCGIRLDRYQFESRNGKREVFSCPACSFSAAYDKDELPDK